MIGLGTLINVAGILAGGLGGLLFGKRLTTRFQDTLMSANGICVLFIGISGCLSEMYKITTSGLEAGGTMMMIVCFALGALFGELLNLESRFEQFGEWLSAKPAARAIPALWAALSPPPSRCASVPWQ